MRIMKALARFPGTLAVLAGLVCVATSATAGTIVSLGMDTVNPYGWWRGGGIGVTDPGGTGNPFYTDANGAILPGGIPSGTYLLFFGYESYWPGAPGNTATLTVNYSDSTQKSAQFLIGSITALGSWTRLSGDPSLSLGGGGFTVTPDRVGTPAFQPPDGIPDVVLLFSDTGGVPEPATVGLLAAGIAVLGLLKRIVRS